ncbi:hypothetical protein GJ496_001044 [Pomphorhynchus laevis]|nr:hypothetical protein GJ496_001044 [Pomphorhynchus laevis]
MIEEQISRTAMESNDINTYIKMLMNKGYMENSWNIEIFQKPPRQNIKEEINEGVGSKIDNDFKNKNEESFTDKNTPKARCTDVKKSDSDDVKYENIKFKDFNSDDNLLKNDNSEDGLSDHEHNKPKQANFNNMYQQTEGSVTDSENIAKIPPDVLQNIVQQFNEHNSDKTLKIANHQLIDSFKNAGIFNEECLRDRLAKEKLQEKISWEQYLQISSQCYNALSANNHSDFNI